MATLSAITRRAAFKLFPVAGAAIAAPAAAVASSKANEATATDRMAYHLAEFRKAAEAAYPTICEWKVEQGVDPDSRDCVVINVTATRQLPPKFQGDGAYLIAFWPHQAPSAATIRQDGMYEGERFFRVVINDDGKPYEFWSTERKINELIVGKIRGALA